MRSSQVWLPLVLALLGIGGTLASALLTQRGADQREIARVRLEADRETVRHAREDAARVFDHRRDAYVKFLEAAASELFAWSEDAESGYRFTPPP
jgi:hypothetical protein